VKKLIWAAAGLLLLGGFWAQNRRAAREAVVEREDGQQQTEVEMKAIVTGLVVAALAGPVLAEEAAPAPTKTTTESLTVIAPAACSEVRILTKDVSTTEVVAPSSARDDVVADTAPRKARIVVVPAVFSQELRSKFERELSEKFGITDRGVIENPGYTSYIIDALVNSRKVDVLERESLESVVKELEFGESDYADVAKVVKIGRMLNADYVVIPEIRYLVITSEEKQIPYLGRQQEQIKGKFATNVRVVDVATSQIIASNIDDVEKKTRFKDNLGPRSQQLRDFISGLYAESGANEAANVIDTAYPMKVVGVAPGQIVINRGKGAIEAGEVLNVYQTGEMMIDPDTKESLGYHEARIGSVRVVEVNEKTAKADVIEASAPIQRLYICRRDAKASAPQPVEPPAPKLN